MKNLTNSVLALTLAGLGLVLTPGTASAEFLDFTIAPTALGDNEDVCSTVSGGSGACIADRIGGSYVERFIVTDFDPVTGSGTFTTYAYFNVEAFQTNEATETLNSTGVTDDYGLYALFTATGSFEPNLSGGFDFTADPSAGAAIALYSDLDLNTGKSLPVGGGFALTNTTDDDLLASAVLLGGEGHNTDDPLDSGDFELNFGAFALTLDGEAYFIDPRPFYLAITVRGLFDNFIPSDGFNQELTGSGNAQFEGQAVPEPATLTLLGMGLLGSSWVARRRRKA